jgi:hypothetical protein
MDDIHTGGCICGALRYRTIAKLCLARFALAPSGGAGLAVCHNPLILNSFKSMAGPALGAVT